MDTWSDPAALAAALRGDALRVLRRKRQAVGSSETASLRELVGAVKVPTDLEGLAHELIIGQWIGDAKKLAAGPTSVKRVAHAEEE